MTVILPADRGRYGVREQDGGGPCVWQPLQLRWSEARCELAVLVGVQSPHELVELRGVGPLLEVDRLHRGHELLPRDHAVVVQIERLERLADRAQGGVSVCREV